MLSWLFLYCISTFILLFGSVAVCPDSKVHGAKMGPIWGRQDSSGPHVCPVNFAIWDVYLMHIPPWQIKDKRKQRKAVILPIIFNIKTRTVNLYRAVELLWTFQYHFIKTKKNCKDFVSSSTKMAWNLTSFYDRWHVLFISVVLRQSRSVMTFLLVLE